MENIEECKCVIGIINDYDNTRMVTLDGLKYHIKNQLELKQAFEKDVLFKDYNRGIKGWTLADYCDKRKSTDLTRFNYCPLCGKKIDWKAIKGGRMADITNYERIKNMSIEEMSYIFAMVKLNSVKELYPKFEIENNMIAEQCENCFKWLNSEVEDD